jgi:hypothetical protein
VAAGHHPRHCSSSSSMVTVCIHVAYVSNTVTL